MEQYIYLLKSKDGLSFKIGKSVNTYMRIKRLPNEININESLQFKVNDPREVFDIETHLHWVFRQFNDTNRVQEDGYTEWFFIAAWDLVVKYLETNYRLINIGSSENLSEIKFRFTDKQLERIVKDEIFYNQIYERDKGEIARIKDLAIKRNIIALNELRNALVILKANDEVLGFDDKFLFLRGKRKNISNFSKATQSFYGVIPLLHKRFSLFERLYTGSLFEDSGSVILEGNVFLRRCTISPLLLRHNVIFKDEIYKYSNGVEVPMDDAFPHIAGFIDVYESHLSEFNSTVPDSILNMYKGLDVKYSDRLTTHERQYANSLTRS